MNSMMRHVNIMIDVVKRGIAFIGIVVLGWSWAT